jgi:hypothetical protein
VYFVREVLSNFKTRFTQMQKLVYAILMTKRKLRHYFDAHPITVVSKYPLGEVIQNPEAEGRIAKWALELTGQNITYAPRSAIKSQVLADFVAEWTEMRTPSAKIEHETWIMYFDGSVKKEGAGVGLVFISPLGMCMEYMVRLHFPTSNNTAEYEALINSKWIEARPIINIRSEEAVSFFTDIIYRFDIPNTIITDKGTQFTGKKFLNFCDDC